MNKIIFQIGLLAFFVSIVIFASENFTIVEIVSRAFLVFIAVILVTTIFLLVSVLFSGKPKEEQSMMIPRSAVGRKNQVKQNEPITHSAA